MKQYIKFFFLFTLFSCNIFNQNDFLLSKEVKNSLIFYDVYQVGIDNYRYDFALVENSDIISLFSAYLNDATYKIITFEIVKEEDLRMIISNGNFENKSVIIGNEQFELK